MENTFQLFIDFVSTVRVSEIDLILSVVDFHSVCHWLKSTIRRRIVYQRLPSISST